MTTYDIVVYRGAKGVIDHQVILPRAMTRFPKRRRNLGATGLRIIANLDSSASNLKILRHQQHGGSGGYD